MSELAQNHVNWGVCSSSNLTSKDKTLGAFEGKATTAAAKERRRENFIIENEAFAAIYLTCASRVNRSGRMEHKVVGVTKPATEQSEQGLLHAMERGDGEHGMRCADAMKCGVGSIIKLGFCLKFR